MLREATVLDGGEADSIPPGHKRAGALGALLFQANFGWMFATLAAGTLIPALMEQVDPDSKVALFGILTSVGAVVGLIANIVFGSLSDRTRSRWGKRNPWILAGGLVAAASLSAMAVTADFALIVLCYAGFQVGLNALVAPLAAVLPDRIPVARRGSVSAFIGLGQLLAQSAGAVVGAAFLTDVRMGLALAPWVVALTAIIFVTFARDSSSRSMSATPFSLGAVLSTFRIPRDRDFLLALFGRLALLLAFYCVVLYQYFVLQDYIKLDQTAVATTIGTAGIVMAVASGIGTLISGPVSDRIQRRKPLVVGAALTIAVAFIPLVVAPSLLSFLAFIGFGGFAYGVYIAVDQALMSEVLPDSSNHGKDMGILNIANTAPQLIAPALAALALGAGLGYSGLFTIAAALCIVSAVLISLIRRAR